MKRQDPANDDVRAFGDLLAHVDIGMLTTLARDGSMVTRPLGTQELQSDGSLVFFTHLDDHKVAELAADSRTNVGYANPEKNVYLSVRGRARIVRDTDKVRELWSAGAEIFFDGPDDPNLGLLIVDVTDVSYWEGPHNVVTQAYAFVKAKLTGDVSALGQQGHLALFG